MRPGREAREQIAIRLDSAKLTLVDQWAAQEERTRSDMIRRLLSEAIQQREQEGK